MRYLILWVVSFIAISIMDALWHVVIFKSIYLEGLSRIGMFENGKLAIRALPGITSQVIMIACMVTLVVFSIHAGAGLAKTAITGAMAGVLAISLYGIINYTFIKDWGLTITILEVIWGPIIGSSGALFIAWAYSLLKIT